MVGVTEEKEIKVQIFYVVRLEVGKFTFVKASETFQAVRDRIFEILNVDNAEGQNLNVFFQSNLSKDSKGILLDAEMPDRTLEQAGVIVEGVKTGQFMVMPKKKPVKPIVASYNDADDPRDSSFCSPDEYYQHLHRLSDKNEHDNISESTPETNNSDMDSVLTPSEDVALATKRRANLRSTSNISNVLNLPIMSSEPNTSTRSNRYEAQTSQKDFVGLVNLAMTCYLNSLIQALYMTPEFRNALYNWEFDENENETKSIPYQLQKLFLNLQTSTCTAVETTPLTKSFGWDTTETWQQHDIQELCRVMFDALEQKFKNTEQADLINRLYEGKMIDYVKCLECENEKSREDTFLDIPLPVRAFGRGQAYKSIEEALNDFVQPETLEDNNQYFCERCNKKVNAHKGLKFSKFPYLLTLHLKRFDFDYDTLHRIKLNDRVTFPQKLDLSHFINKSTCQKSNLSNNENDCNHVNHNQDMLVDKDEANSSNNADSSATESVDSTALNSSVEMDCQDSNEHLPTDETLVNGVTNGSSEEHENIKNKIRSASTSDSGELLYELFAIMIHSGNAAGGHYYVYIKDFTSGLWYCFNDTHVSRIEPSEIERMYGGAPRGNLSYTGSTNAYMLMYRQIDPQRNCLAYTVDQFPQHIKKLYDGLMLQEEEDRQQRVRESNMCRLRVFAKDLIHDRINMADLHVDKTITVLDAIELAREDLYLCDVLPQNCRLVQYNRYTDTIECSFEGKESQPISSLLSLPPNQSMNQSSVITSYSRRSEFIKDFFLEVKESDQEFSVYKPGGVNLKVFYVDIRSSNYEPQDVVIHGPILVRGYQSETIGEFKQCVAKALIANALNATNSSDLEFRVLKGQSMTNLSSNEKDEKPLERYGIDSDCKIYVAPTLDEDLDKNVYARKLNTTIDLNEHRIIMTIRYPVVESDPNKTPDNESGKTNGVKEEECTQNALDEIVVQKRKCPQVCSRKVIAATPSTASHSERNSPLPVEVASDQSNSEDSSLSDSDRTLVNDAPDDDGDPSSNASPTDCSPIDTNQPIPMDWPPHYFNVLEIKPSDKDQTKTMKCRFDNRMSLAQIKKELEKYVQITQEYFKVYTHTKSGSKELTNLKADFKNYVNGGNDVLEIQLGRAIKPGETAGKLFLLNFADDIEPYKYLCDWGIEKNTRVGDIKRPLYDELMSKSLIPPVSFDHFRLRDKRYKMCGDVFLDDDKFRFTYEWELIVQILKQPETVVSRHQLPFFVQQWCPSTLSLKAMEDITVDNPSNLIEQIAALSGIEPDNILLANLKAKFPLDVSDLNEDVPWLTWMTNDEFVNAKNPFDHLEGVFIYKDKTEEVKELTNEMRNKMSQRESQKNTVLRDVISTRKEKGLKIYFDSPKKM